MTWRVGVPRVAIAVLLLALPVVGRGADEVVSDCSNDTELRTKLTSMQSGAGGTLTFACATTPATILLSAELPAIFAPTTIDGGGSVTLSGGDEVPFIYVDAAHSLTLRRIVLTNFHNAVGDGGAVFNQGTLVLDGVEILNSTTPNDFNGGAIATHGPLTITDSRLAFNEAGGGGAVYATSFDAKVTITNSVLHRNYAFRQTLGGGGAILPWDGARLTIEGGELSDNQASRGGAIAHRFATSSAVTIRGTIMRRNSANGGGIFVGAESGDYRPLVNLTGVTLVDNSGTAIECENGTVRLLDTTLSANFNGGIEAINCGVELTNVTLSDNEGAGMVVGSDASAALVNVTIAGNSASNGAGGIRVTGGTVAFRNVALAVNTGGDCQFTDSSVSHESSLSSDLTCGFGAGRGGLDLKLDPLAHNGGPTQTHLPRPDSPVIDRGTTTDCPATDQRGAQRPFGISCDVGAVEVGAVPPSTTTTTPTSSSTSTTLPGGACAAPCPTVDPCRPQACVQSACVSQELAGFPSASCACERPLPGACADQALPPKVQKPITKACILLNAAVAGPELRPRKLVKAEKKWRAAERLLFKRPAKRLLSPDCVAALAADYADAASRVIAFLQAPPTSRR